MKKLYSQPNIEFINLILTADVLSTSTGEDNVGDIWDDGDDLFGDDFEDFQNKVTLAGTNSTRYFYVLKYIYKKIKGCFTLGETTLD